MSFSLYGMKWIRTKRGYIVGSAYVVLVGLVGFQLAAIDLQFLQLNRSHSHTEMWFARQCCVGRIYEQKKTIFRPGQLLLLFE